jgi:hypothetical protein
METRWSEEPGEPATSGDGATHPGTSFDELKARLQELNDKVKSFIAERPKTCLLGALALGYVIARLARTER